MMVQVLQQHCPLLSKAHNSEIQLMDGWMKGEGSFHSILLNQRHWDQSIFQVQLIRNFDILLFNSSNCCQIYDIYFWKYIFGILHLSAMYVWVVILGNTSYVTKLKKEKTSSYERHCFSPFLCQEL